MGIGSVPDAALSQLTNHRNLGIHTERAVSVVFEVAGAGGWGWKNGDVFKPL